MRREITIGLRQPRTDGTGLQDSGSMEEINAGVISPCVYLLFPLGLIWFPEVAGSFTGYIGRGGNIDTETPPILVSIFGWLFLVGPLLLPFFLGD